MKKKLLALALSAAMVFSQCSFAWAEDFGEEFQAEENVSPIPAEAEIPTVEENTVPEFSLEEAASDDISIEEIPFDEMPDFGGIETEDPFDEVNDLPDIDDQVVTADDSDFLPEGEASEEKTESKPEKGENNSEIIFMEAEEHMETLDGSSMSTATNMSLTGSTTYTTYISSSNSIAYYKIVLPSSGKLLLNAKAYTHWIYYNLYDANGNEMAERNPVWTESAGYSNITYLVDLNKGTYYWAVRQDTYAAPDTGYVYLTPSFVSAGESFTEYYGGSNNTMATANTISLSTVYRGWISIDDYTEFYKFTAPKSGQVRVTLKSEFEGTYEVTMYDSSGSYLGDIEQTFEAENEEKTSVAYLNAGTYYVKLSVPDEGTGRYYIAVSVVDCQETFQESGNGNNNSRYYANSISLNTTYRGLIGLNDAYDYYKFTVPVSGVVNLTFNANNMSYVYLRILDVNGNELWSKNPMSDSSDLIKQNIDISGFTPATYYFVVERDDEVSVNTGFYNFALSVNMPVPVLSNIQNNENGVYFSWKSTEGASKYRVYRKTASTNWVSLGVTSATSIVDKTVVSGTRYTYTVRSTAADGTAISGFNTTGKSITYIAAPVIHSISNQKNYVNISWNKVGGAVKYRVFRKTGSGSWTNMGDTTNTAWNDTRVTTGTSYTYTVRCIDNNGNYTSAYKTAGKSIYYVAAPVLNTPVVQTNGVTVSWGKVNGVTKYRVFRKTATTNWQGIGDSTSTSYTDKSVSSGVSYTYTVRCLNSAGTGYSSGFDTTGKTVYYVAAPVISSVNLKPNGVYVAWGRVTGAARYRVYRKTQTGSWVGLGTTTSTSYLDTSASSGNAYYYTVRALNSAGAAVSNFYSPGSRIYYVVAPTLNPLQVKTDSVVVNWNAVKQASKYAVFRKVAGGSWAQIGMTSGTSYNDATVVSGTTYYYTVRCMNADSKCISSFDPNGKGVRFVQAPNFQLVKVSNSIYISWPSVSGLLSTEKYRVRRQVKGSGNWQPLTTTSGTSYLDTTAQVGVTYTYSVRCINTATNAFTSSEHLIDITR